MTKTTVEEAKTIVSITLVSMIGFLLLSLIQIKSSLRRMIIVAGIMVIKMIIIAIYCPAHSSPVYADDKPDKKRVIASKEIVILKRRIMFRE
ncbi:hypothetical protein [Ekhidna sp.]